MLPRDEKSMTFAPIFEKIQSKVTLLSPSCHSLSPFCHPLSPLNRVHSLCGRASVTLSPYFLIFHGVLRCFEETIISVSLLFSSMKWLKNNNPGRQSCASGIVVISRMFVVLLLLFLFIVPQVSAGVTISVIITTLANGVQKAFYFQLYDHSHGSFIILLFHNYIII